MRAQKLINMATATCPKCKQPIYVPDNKDFVICTCGEVTIINSK
jgi:hypothetical protein